MLTLFQQTPALEAADLWMFTCSGEVYVLEALDNAVHVGRESLKCGGVQLFCYTNVNTKDYYKYVVLKTQYHYKIIHSSKINTLWCQLGIVRFLGFLFLLFLQFSGN